MTFDNEYGRKDFKQVLDALRKSPLAIKAISSDFGKDCAERFANSTETPDEYDEIFVLFLDEIVNEAKVVWVGGLVENFHSEGDFYPIFIKEYGGIFYVDPLEEDHIGYWLDQESACNYAYRNWDDLEEKSLSED